MRLALIDADTLVWLAAYHHKEQQNLQLLNEYMDNAITLVLVNTRADKYAGFMQGPVKSHRHKMFDDYKGNRPPTPDWLNDIKDYIREYLISKWQFQYVNGQETDDAIASAVEKCKNSSIYTVVCSIDKDFKQLVGELYNPKHKTAEYINPEVARVTLCAQLLTGDSTDNIKGLPGVGPATAAKMLMPYKSNRDLYSKVLKAYLTQHGSNEAAGLIDFAENVLKIVLKRDKDFIFKQIDTPDVIKEVIRPSTPAEKSLWD